MSTTTTNEPNTGSGVLVVGSANQDLTSYATRMPSTGETVLGTSFETCPGGKGANQAVAAASIGIAAPYGGISFICRVGPDSFGASLLDNFRRVGIKFDEQSTVLSKTSNNGDTSSIPSTGVAPIIVDNRSGDNAIVVVPGANHALTPTDVRTAMEAMSPPPAIVVVQLEILPETALEVMKVGRELGATTILNPAPAPEGWTLGMDFLQYVDIVIPNESELRVLLSSTGGGSEDSNNDDEEGMAKSLLTRGVGKAVIVTLGARGAMIVAKSNDSSSTTTTYVNAPPGLPCEKEPVIDTVGAGDSFCGSLSAYLSAGLDLPAAATRACGVASMSVRKRGAQSSYPMANELPLALRLDDDSDTTTEPSSSEESRRRPFLTFVTSNAKKLEEVKTILGDNLPFELISRDDIDLPELQGMNPVDIAKEKCRLASQQIQGGGGAVLIEDTSLCFNAMGGMPGPYIKWFLQSCGHDGLNDMLVGFEDKSAYAQTIVAFCDGTDSEIQVFEGRTDGIIVRPRGSLDFGWDPIFEPKEGMKKTYAEMTKEEKNAISHRGRSLAKLKEFLIREYAVKEGALQN